MHLRAMCAFIAVLGFTAAVGAQTAAPFALPEPIKSHVKDDRFQIVTALRGLPLGVRGGLQSLFSAMELDIADPGAPFQSTAGSNPALPSRRLVAAGCSMDHCLVYYQRGGGSPVWLVALFHWTPDATRFEWGGIAPRGLATIEAVRQAVLAGTIKGPNKVW